MDCVRLAVTVLGGLSIFIYGMGLMSEGLTQIAGKRLKTALGFMTKNRVAAEVRRFAHLTVETVRRGTGAGEADLKSVEGEIRASTREAKAAIWSDARLRGTHAKVALAVLSVFSCLRDIARHLGNIAVRAPAFA